MMVTVTVVEVQVSFHAMEKEIVLNVTLLQVRDHFLLGASLLTCTQTASNEGRHVKEEWTLGDFEIIDYSDL